MRGVKKVKESLKEVFTDFLSCPLGREEVEAVSGGLVKGKDMTVRQGIAAVQVAKALKGDRKAFELIRAALGEKPDRDPGELPRVIVVRKEE